MSSSMFPSSQENLDDVMSHLLSQQGKQPDAAYANELSSINSDYDMKMQKKKRSMKKAGLVSGALAILGLVGLLRNTLKPEHNQEMLRYDSYSREYSELKTYETLLADSNPANDNLAAVKNEEGIPLKLDEVEARKSYLKQSMADLDAYFKSESDARTFFWAMGVAGLGISVIGLIECTNLKDDKNDLIYEKSKKIKDLNKKYGVKNEKHVSKRQGRANRQYNGAAA